MEELHAKIVRLILKDIATHRIFKQCWKPCHDWKTQPEVKIRWEAIVKQELELIHEESEEKPKELP